SYGRAGPKSGLPGYDPLLQAAGGLISVTGEPGGDGVRVGVSLIDHATGMYAAFAILAALTEGGGHTLDVSLWETALSPLRRERRSTRSRRTRCSRPRTAD